MTNDWFSRRITPNSANTVLSLHSHIFVQNVKNELPAVSGWSVNVRCNIQGSTLLWKTQIDVLIRGHHRKSLETTGAFVSIYRDNGKIWTTEWTKSGEAVRKSARWLISLHHRLHCCSERITNAPVSAPTGDMFSHNLRRGTGSSDFSRAHTPTITVRTGATNMCCGVTANRLILFQSHLAELQVFEEPLLAS